MDHCLRTEMQQTKRKAPSRPQAEKDTFESVARRLECNEDKELFEKKLGKIAKAKPASADK
jgi:hypothetical protein